VNVLVFSNTGLHKDSHIENIPSGSLFLFINISSYISVFQLNIVLSQLFG
jgi:hypothetical protein